MKSIALKMIVSVVCFTFFIIHVNAKAISANRDSVPLPSRDAYLKKAKTQHDVAVTMVTVGSVAFLTGTIVTIGITLQSIEDLFGEDESKDPTGYIIMAVTGGALALGSIPVFRAARKNKRAAMSVVRLKTEYITINKMQGLTKVSYPAIALQFNF